MEITASDIRAMSRSAAPRIVAGIVDNQKAIFDNGIDTPLRLCHFMAQLAHESAHFGVTREFASGAAYEGRHDLGNFHEGDGPKYRGRGLLQTTGRANYRHASTRLRQMNPAAPDFEHHPEQLEQFPWALLAGISYWKRRDINPLADRDDVRAVTRAINGGLNGLEDRKRYLATAKRLWMEPHQATSSHPVTRKGDQGTNVMELQNELIDAGYHVLPDGDFGEHTDEAVRAFQAAHELQDDGIVGARTWALLLSRATNS